LEGRAIGPPFPLPDHLRLWLPSADKTPVSKPRLAAPQLLDDALERRRDLLVPERPNGEGGFTIVEVLVAVLILVAGLLGTVTMINSANSTTLTNNLRETANNLSREVVEAANAISYTSVTNNGLVPALQAQPGLADASSASGWQIIRHGIPYTLTATACRVDDSVDGVGTHSASADPPYCAGSTGTADSNPDDYRRVTIDVTWTSRNVTRRVRQVMIATTSRTSAAVVPQAKTVTISSCSPSSGCDATALAAGEVDPCYGYFSTNCFPSATACPPSTGPGCANAVNFAVTTTGSPPTVKWAVDGVLQGNASGSGNSWTFTWSLGTVYPQTPVDGVYDVTAQAYDASGAPTGDPAVKTVTLNRFTPDITAFAVPIAGRNPLWSNFPEVEIYPVTTGARVDRDIIGYSPVRYHPATKNGSTQVEIVSNCYVSASTACQDIDSFSNPTWLEYEVYPNDRAPNGEIRYAGNGVTCTNAASEATCSRDVNSANTRPDAPTGLTATSSGGTVTLNWNVPTTYGGAGDPDGGASGDCVDTFRIYRTATTASAPTINDRYDRTPFGVIATACGTTASTSYDDLNPGGVPHKYWITSVDTHLAESTLVGPVTQ
jgi:Tfp pilus assembly protein PilV